MADTDIWVVNASPIITLAKIGRLDLLLSDNRRLIIPEAVAEEIEEGPVDDPAKEALAGGWNGDKVNVTPDPAVIEWGLGAGETAVISHSKRIDALAVLDDRSARTAASVLGVRMMGTLGVILRARREARIRSAVDEVMALRKHGLRLSDEVIRTAIFRTTGEVWPVPPSDPK